MNIWSHEFDNSPRHCWYGDMTNTSVPDKEKEHIVANPTKHGTVEWLRFIRKMNKQIPGIFGEPRFEKEKNFHIEVYPKNGEPLFKVYIPKKGSVIIECYDENLFALCDGAIDWVQSDYQNAGKEGFTYAGLPSCN